MKRILIALAAGVAVLAASAKINDTQEFEENYEAFAATTPAEDSSELAEYGTKPANVPYPLTSSGAKYLSLDTGDTTLWYTNSSSSAYFDMDIQLNPMSAAPEVSNDTKIAVYLNASSNLVVVSGPRAVDQTPVTNVTTTTVEPGTWVRLTISKAASNFFAVHIGGSLVGTYASLTDSSEITSIGFQGSGALDNFVARTTDPYQSSYRASICVVDGYEGSDFEKYAYYSEALADTLTDVERGAARINIGSGAQSHYCDGTEGHEYEIPNATCLKALAEGVAVNSAVRSLNFIQTDDIDMSGEGRFAGVGESGDDVSAGIAFAGVYDGCGYTISDVTLEPCEYAGVFRKVTGTVKNLTVENMGFDNDATGSFGCAIVGEADNNAVLQNLTATGSFCATKTATHNTAAIVVNVQTAAENGGTVTIANCTNNAAVYGSHHRVGGILAYTRNQGNVEIVDCANNGDLSWAIKESGNPGVPRGIAGIAACPEGTGSITIANCVNTGAFTVTGATNETMSAAATGDIVGHAYKGTLEMGGNTFRASANAIGGAEGVASVDGATYAVAADADGYLTTVAQGDLAAGNTYTLIADVAASETPVFTLAAAGDTIAFNTNGYSFAGSVAVATPNMLDVEAATVDETVTFTAVGGTAVASLTKEEVKTDYNTIAKALADAEADDTVVLEADDSEENVSLPTGVSFALNDHTYNGKVTAAAGNGYAAVENNGVYAVVDNTASAWTGSAGDGLWATAGNWSTGALPDQYTTVTFSGDADVGIGAGNDVRSVAAFVINGAVTFHHDTRNYAYYPAVKVCGGNVTGTGTMTLERCGFVGDGSATINVACPVVFAGDSATSHDCFLQNGPIVFNSTVSSTTGRLHLQTPVTFNGAVNLANATITSAITGGSAPTFNGAVTLGAGATISTYSFTYNDALTIGEGAVVSIGSTTQNYGENFTMTGSGRFIGNTVLPTGKAKEALTQSTWTGTFELLNKTVTDHWWISEYGNANSKVCFNNVTTILYNDGNTGGSGNKNHMVAGIEIGAGGFKINGSYSRDYSWTLPAISGAGTFTVGIAGGTAGTHNKNVYLPADCSEFSGNIAFADDTANTRLVFGTTDREFKEKTICVGSDAVVGAGATWTASDEIYLDGIVKASANTSLSTVVGSGKIVYGAKPTGTHTFGEGWNGIGALDYKGDSRIDLADYVNTIAQKCSCDTVEVVDECTMLLDNFFGADVNPTLKVSGFVVINDGSSNNKRTVSNVTGDGVLVFGAKGAMVNYAIDNVVGWNGVITNSSSATVITNLVSGTGTVVYKVAASTTIGADFGGEVEYAVAPSAAPAVDAESEATVYLNFNYAGMNIAPYGNAKSTIKLGNLSADNAYLNDGSGSGTGRIPSKVIVAGDVTINNGWTQYPSFDWTGSKTLQFNEFTVDGSFALLSTRTWNDAQCYYYIKSLNGDGAGTITVGAGYSLRIDAVDFAEAPSGDDCIVPLTVGAGTATAAAGNLYGADGVLNGPIPVTVNGEATEQSLVYNAEKGGLVLYVPPADVTIAIPSVANTTPSVTANGEPVEIVNDEITVADGAAIVLTYTSATHEVTNGTIEFTAADGYTVDVSGVTTAQYVAKIDGGASYTSLQAAIDATAQSNSKVVLVADESVGATVPAVNGKMFYFYADSFEHGDILDATGNFITTVTEETTSIGGEDVTATKYRVESAFMAVTISETRTLYGMASANDALAAANAGPLGTTVEFFSGDPSSYAEYLPMFTYDEQTGIYTKTLEPVAAVYSGVQQLSVHTSLADAVAAAEDGQTVTLLADDRVSFAGVQVTAKVPSNGSIVINKNLTINGDGFTVYGNTNAEIMNATGSSTPGYDMVADLVDGSNLLGFFVKSGNVTFTNITLTEFGDTAYVNKFGYTPIQTASAYTGTLTLTGVNFNKFNRTAVCVRGGTLAMTGGTIAGGTVNKNNGDYFQQPVEVRGGTATISGVTITGGNDIAGNGGGAIVAWGNATLNNVVVDFTGYGVWSDGPAVAITGENTSIKATVNALFAEEAGTITVAAGDFTGSLAVDSDPNSAISLTGGTYDRDVNAFCADGYEAKESAGVWTVAKKSSAPLEPGQSSSETYPTEEAAQAAAESVEIAVPAAVAAELDSDAKVTYKAMFEAKVVPNGEGGYKVEVALTDTAETALQEQADADAAEVVEDLTEDNVTLTTTPGLYYSFEYGTSLESMTEVGDRTLATGSSLELARPATENATAGFYKVLVNVTDK